MQLEQPPLLHDGGYWYVVPVSGLTVNLPIERWCAWYKEDMTAALIRTPEPVAGLNMLSLAPAGVISGAMPRGRIGGI